MAIKVDDILILLGAGCSADAKIPTATQMLRQIEKDCLSTEDGDFKQLYNYVKSAIIYGRGIHGQFGCEPNIEELINVLIELEKREKNIVFPFIANWNNLLVNLAGRDFESVTKFMRVIKSHLLRYVVRDNYPKDADYYRSFFEFQQKLEMPLRIFSLNYDLCLEQLCPGDYTLELGFDADNVWDYRRFEYDEKTSVPMYLYKLHGSVNWKRENNQLIYCSHPCDNPELIFGIPAKLQSYDPYLFYIYELRKYSLMSKVIIAVGYGFGDDHINDLLRQSMQLDSKRQMLCVSGVDADSAKQSADLCKRLEIDDSKRLRVFAESARQFLTETLNKDLIQEVIGEEGAAPF